MVKYTKNKIKLCELKKSLFSIDQLMFYNHIFYISILGSAKQFKNEEIPSQWAQGRADVGQLQRRENEPDNVSASMWSENSNNINKNTTSTTSTSTTTTNNNSSNENNIQSKSTDPYGLLGLLGVIRMTDPDRSMLALGSDLTTLGLDLNTAE